MQTDEKIKEIWQRVDISYEEAEKFLFKANGDVDLAIRLIKEKKYSFFSRVKKEVRRLFKELLSYYIKIEKEERVYVDLPMIFFVIFLLFAEMEAKIWILAIGIGIIFITESKVSISKRKKIKKTLLVSKQKETSSQKTEVSSPVKEEDDYNEISIDK